MLVASTALLVSPAAGAFGLLAWFGESGTGPGQLGPVAPALAVDANGRSFVTDRDDDRIEAYEYAHGTTDGGWDFTDPQGVAVAPNNTVIVSGPEGVWRHDGDATWLEQLSDLTTGGAVAAGPSGQVAVVDRATGMVRLLGSGTELGPFTDPVGLAYRDDGSLLVADDGDDQVHTFSASGVATGSWPAAAPAGIATAPDGSVIVSDGASQLVHRFSASGALLETFGQSGEDTTDGHLINPRGVATDCRGSVYVVDDSQKRIHVYGVIGDAPPCAPEPDPTPTPTPTPKPVVPVVVPPEPEPLLGVRGRATTVSGDVLVGDEGHLHPLNGSELIPVGSFVDATHGRVKLEFETAPGPDRQTYGRFGEGEFFDGAFTVGQPKNSSLVTLNLLDDLDTPAGTRARASATKKLKVWGKAKGKFRTKGRNGAATVLGTQWLTEERPDGTLFRVREGTVRVKEFSTGRTIVLHAGDSYLTRPACTSKRRFRIRLRLPRGAVVQDAVVRVRGKRIAIRRGKRYTAPIDLRGAPKGRVRVRIRVRLADGSRLTGVREYRTCAPGSGRVTPPQL